MRLAVFSDMHANEIALSTCLSYADHVGVDGYIFLGDHISDCPYPHRTLDIIRAAARKYPTWALRGNREDYLLRHQDNPDDNWKVSSSTGSLLYTYQNLTEVDLRYLRSMPLSDVVDMPGCTPLRIAHASPTNNSVLLYPGTEVLENVLRTCPQQTLLSGHSHFQFRYESNGKQGINPGSVGLPSHGQPKAQFALVTYLSGRWSARLMNVDYDKEAEIRQFEESGLSEMSRVWAMATVKTIRQGGSWMMDCLQLARKLCPGDKTDIPESCWEDAAMQLGIM